MSRYFALCLLLLNLSAQAEWDFSQAYLLPSIDASRLDVGGVIDVEGERLSYYALRFGVDASHRLALLEQQTQGQFFLAGLDTKDFNALLDAIPSPTQTSEQFAAQLKGTVWTGDYQTARNVYRTQLVFTFVTDTFALATVEHTSLDPERSTLLQVDIAGSVTSQFLYDVPDDDNNKAVWQDSAVYYGLIEKMLKEALKAEERLKEDEVLEPLVFPTIQAQRFTMRLKRLEAHAARHTGNAWGRNVEYRMTIEGSHLSGNVGTLPDQYGKDDTLSQSSLLTLTLVK